MPNCKIGGIKPMSSMRCMGVIPYLINLKDDSYSDPNEVLPLRSNLKEIDCSSMSVLIKKGKKYKNKFKLNTSTIITLWKCIEYLIDRGLYATKSEISKDQLE